MIRKECIREIVKIALIVEKMVESCVRLFGYVWRRPIESPSKDNRSTG